MIWKPSEVKPKREQFNEEQEVNDLTETEETPQVEDNTEELESLKTELEEAKAKIEEFEKSETERAEAELNSLREKVNELISDEEKEIFNVNAMGKPELEAVLMFNKTLPTKPGTKTNSVRPPPNTDNKGATDKTVNSILERHKKE